MPLYLRCHAFIIFRSADAAMPDFILRRRLFSPADHIYAADASCFAFHFRLSL